MKVIGFANKYYTLWDVVIETITHENYKDEIHHNSYIKNISFDKNTAFTKYPTAYFDANLCGKNNDFIYGKIIWTNIDTFRYGTLSGTKIEDCTDFKYLEAYYNDLAWDEHRDFVQNFLISKGYVLNDDGDLLSPIYIERQKEIIDNQKDIMNCINNKKSISFIPIRNLNDNGEYINIEDAITYIFTDIAKQNYNGFQYYLPVLNGKAKLIKNKCIEITKYTFTRNEYNELTIHALEFNIKNN